MGKKILSIIFITIFAGYFGCINLFPHKHVIEGKIIVHSHPFSGTTENPNHGHTPAQFNTIAQLSLLLMLAAIFYFKARKLVDGVSIYCQEKINPVSRPLNHHHQLRAPPEM